MKNITKIVLNNEEYKIGKDVDLTPYMKKQEWEVFEEIYDTMHEDFSKRLHKLEKAPSEITITLPDESTEINNLTDEQRATIYEAITNKKQLVVKFNNSYANEYYVVYDFKGYNPEIGSNAWSETFALWQDNKYYTLIIYNASETGWMRVQVKDISEVDLTDYYNREEVDGIATGITNYANTTFAKKDEINQPQFEVLSEDDEIPSKENVMFFIFEDIDKDRTIMKVFLNCPDSSSYWGAVVNETTGQIYGGGPYCKGTYNVLAKEGDVIKAGDFDWDTNTLANNAVTLEYQPISSTITTVTISGYDATPVVTVEVGPTEEGPSEDE